jgi:hypothetical protein
MGATLLASGRLEQLERKRAVRAIQDVRAGAEAPPAAEAKLA